MTIRELQKACLDQATASGFNDREIPVPEQIALAHSELSEALECFRNDEPLLWAQLQPDGSEKPMGLASEYADCIIRLCHYAGLLGFDLENVIEKKRAYNATRSHRHGGKRI